MNLKKILVTCLALTMCVSVVGCKKKGGKSETTPEVKQVPITAGFLSEEVNYRASKKIADKYKIDMSDEKLESYVNSNYGNNKINSPEDLLTTKASIESVVGKEQALKSYAQLYVEQELRTVLDQQEGQMEPQEIEEYKVKYKDYLDKIGIPEDQRAEYVKTLKDTYVTQQKLTDEWNKAVKEATIEVFNEYAPEYLESTGLSSNK